MLARLLAWGQRLLAAENATEKSPISRTVLSDTRLSKKLREACAISRQGGYRYLWFDACCIDKTSSSELSEAINSMYLWYQHSAMCFVLLSDVDVSEDITAPDSAFRRSKWFTRGWTLQELLAPANLIFVCKNWQIIGTKGMMGTLLSEITRIDPVYLRDGLDVRKASVAKRMSWAALRVTTREEDEAYCLLGIFGINMPTLYGEGRYAFIRLQEEILKQEYDQSIFAWTVFKLLEDEHGRQLPLPTAALTRVPDNAVISRPRHLDPTPTNGIYVGQMHFGLIHGSHFTIDTKAITAITPAVFINCAMMSRISHKEFCKRLGMSLPPPVYTPTPFGMRTTLPLMPFEGHFLVNTPHEVNLPGPRDWYIAVLACEDNNWEVEGHLVAFVCSLPARLGSQDGSERRFDPIPILAGGVHCYLTRPDGVPGASSIRTVMLTPDDIRARRDSIRVADVHIPMLPSPLSMAANHHLRRGFSAHDLEHMYHRNVDIDLALRDIPVTIRLAPWYQSLLRAQGLTTTEMRPVPVATGPPLCVFILRWKDGVQLMVQCQPLMSFERDGASIRARLHDWILPVNRGGPPNLVEPVRHWGEWQTVTEVAPLVAKGCDSEGSSRTIHLTLKHHEVGMYMLGIEPL